MRGLLVIPVVLLLTLPAAALYLNTGLAEGSNAPVPTVQTDTPSGAPAAPATEPAPSAPPSAPPSTVYGPVGPSGSQVVSAGRSSAWSKAPLLEEALERAMTGFSGEYSVIVQELDSDHRWTHNPDQRYHPASTIKMPVTLYTLEQYRTGQLGWQDLITYTQADFESPGGGAFESAPFGGRYPVENLVGRALRYSNNVAVNMLGRHLGWDKIRAWTATIGGDLYREADGSPRVTAMSELGWWLHLHKLSKEEPKHAELLLQPLREVAYDGRITAGLPQGVPHLHKFGSYDGYYHDTGIIYTEKPYVLIVLTHGADVTQADLAIARLSAEVYKVMTADEA